MLRFLNNFFSTFRFADIFDILIITVFLYTFINWLRRSASRRILYTVVIFAFIYLLSRVFEMYMTEMLIKSLFIVILIASIIVFQSDIRRLVDWISTGRMFSRSVPRKSSSKIVDVLTESVLRMASEKTGALIILKGKEPWDRHIHGGIQLNGQISAPLLYSIFDKYSPGHDGAVLIDGEKIIKFAVHLPLSNNLEKLSYGGTRHAAGLGLSEVNDSLVIIVSEERGTVSIAHRGILTQATTPGEVKNRINNYWQNNYSTAENPIQKWWKNRSLLSAALSFVVAFAAWFLFAYQSETVYRTYVVPVEFRNMPENLTVKELAPLESKITLSGSDQAFRLIDPATLAISIDLGGLKKGNNTIVVDEDNLSLPSDVRLFNVSPEVIKVSAQGYKESILPIEVRTSGKLAQNLDISALYTVPGSARLLVPEDLQNSLTKIPTEPVNLNRLSASGTLRLKLISPPGTRFPENQQNEVLLHYQVVKKKK